MLLNYNNNGNSEFWRGYICFFKGFLVCIILLQSFVIFNITFYRVSLIVIEMTIGLDIYICIYLNFLHSTFFSWGGSYFC